MLDLWPTKILPWLLTFALTEDEDQSTGYIGVPPPCTFVNKSVHTIVDLEEQSYTMTQLNEYILIELCQSVGLFYTILSA